MGKRGGNRITSVVIEETDWLALRGIAAQKGVPVTAVVRWAIKQYLDTGAGPATTAPSGTDRIEVPA